jgi:hypothetical protein
MKKNSNRVEVCSNRIISPKPKNTQQHEITKPPTAPYDITQFAIIFHSHRTPMEALLNTSSAAYLTPKAPKFVITNCCSSLKNQNPCMKFANGYSPFTFSGQFSTQKLPIGLRGSVIVGANKNHKSKKEDTHSFVPKQDEATGFFPEAVLLKEVALYTNPRVFYFPFFGVFAA